MSFKNSITTCFNKYGDFTGRASRSEYWYWLLFTVLVDFSVRLLLIGFVNISGIHPFDAYDTTFLIRVFTLWVFLLPSLAVLSRRLHDINLPAWVGITIMGFLIFTSSIFIEMELTDEILIARFLAAAILLVFLCKKGDEGKNQYGVLEKP